MTHLDDDELISYSFGTGAPNAAQREHLRTCPRCAAELTALDRLISAGKSLGDVDLVDPPESVWKGVHTELELASDLSGTPQEKARPVAKPTAESHVVRARPRGWRRPGKRQRGAVLLAAAAAAAVVGLIAGIVGTTLLTRPDDQRLVAEAELEPFPNWDASGSARVEEDNSGARSMVIDLSVAGDGLTEVWLIDPATSGLISLGLVEGDTGTFSVPGNLDLSRYSVVDISREPDDGNPAHSGDSIVRGELRSS
ncbi:anti-sigma factor [Mycetocola zhadangensis]|uniref:Anti-sigma factor n=1 Tax=Mycetocola zhadangensis TaxID=1164595 RepID=A0A3L7ISH5_9MICO|nr:anti-sigma factor [Mycetocola zhadangensis]RLQ81127.1 anti-sigma factor [Mycetocola zhadangensis]GGF05039.1 hypothetical protein GCM10011313_30160 [Mycetocola zhadangensis]